MRVLVIDDNPAYLAACVAVLTEDDHDVIAGGSFEEGRRWLLHDVFDALIADVRLGPYNGLHLITLAPATTIKVAISAFLDVVIRHAAEQAGARFFVKPADYAGLSALLLPQPPGPRRRARVAPVIPQRQPPCKLRLPRPRSPRRGDRGRCGIQDYPPAPVVVTELSCRADTSAV